jgi:hypothetical protein
MAQTAFLQFALEALCDGGVDVLVEMVVSTT